MYHIYVLKSTKCNKVYIGITTDPKRRERQHKNVANKMWKTLTKCGRAVKRYGPETFSLEVKESTPNKHEAADIEKKWIARFGKKRLWNSSSGGEASYGKTRRDSREGICETVQEARSDSPQVRDKRD